MIGDLVAGLLGILAGTAVVVGAIQQGTGTPVQPQPGFFPLLGGVALIVLSLLLLVQTGLGRSTGTQAFAELRRPALLVAGMSTYVAILDLTGHVPATALLAAVCLRVLGVQSWRAVGVASVALAAGTYLLFARVLGIELPVGLWERLG